MAVLPTILSTARPRQENRREAPENTCPGCIAVYFRWIWLIPQVSPILLSRSQF